MSLPLIYFYFNSIQTYLSLLLLLHISFASIPFTFVLILLNWLSVPLLPSFSYSHSTYLFDPSRNQTCSDSQCKVQVNIDTPVRSGSFIDNWIRATLTTRPRCAINATTPATAAATIDCIGSPTFNRCRFGDLLPLALWHSWGLNDLMAQLLNCFEF